MIPYTQAQSIGLFDRIEAEKAWGITTGSSSILIGINDYFTGTTIHDELTGKIVYDEGLYENHGSQT